METPLSTRRLTWSRALVTLNGESNLPLSRNQELEFEAALSKSRLRNSKQQQEKQDRSALFDVTNESPIIGLAMESPSSAIAMPKNKRAKFSLTPPGFGEALFRHKVKTRFLQREEEEADLPKLRLIHFLKSGLLSSPMGLLTPTPAKNTPQSLNSSLLFDFSDEEDKEMIDYYYYYNHDDDDDEEEEGVEDEGEEGGGLIFDVLCEGINKLSVNDKEMTPKFIGKHTRFVYDSDDEILDEFKGGEEEYSGCVSPSVIRLKGLPTPKGKHLRFRIEEDDEVNN